MKLSKKEEATILQVYKTYFDSYKDGDIETITKLLKDDYTQIGSAEAEVFFDKKEATKFLYDTINQVAGKAEIRNRVLKVESLDGYVLIIDLFDMYVLMEDEWSFYAKLRASTLMQKTESGWKFVYQHSSMPDARAEDGNNLAIEKISVENQQLREAVKRRTIELEGKNRELEIETALERVRARTMAMQKSDEMPEVANNLFLQVQELGIPAWSAGYCTWQDDKKAASCSMSSEGVIQKSFSLPSIGVGYNFYDPVKKGKNFYVAELGGKELVAHYNFMRTLPVVGEILDGINKAGFPLPTFQVFHIVYFPHGYLMFITYEAVPDVHDIFKRFGKVFEQTYTRFLDLQKAEAQTHEALIEAALERIRAASLAMHESNELLNVIKVISNQLEKLGIKFNHVSFGQNNSLEDYKFWTSIRGFEEPFMVHIPYINHPMIERLKKARKDKVSFFSDSLTIKQHSRWNEHMFKHQAFSMLSNEQKEKLLNLPFDRSIAILPNIFLVIANYSGEAYSEIENKIITRVGKVFEQAYTRFLDLQKAEAQAREAQIESALERVRSKTMAMHNSDDVGVTVVTLFDEVIKLGLDKSIRCGIGILEGTDGMETWSATSSPNNKVDLKMGMLDMTIHPMLIGLKKAWQSGKTGYSYDYIGKDVTRYYNALNNEPEYPFFVELDTLPENEFHNSFFFSEGIIFAFTENPISEEASKVLNRFAHVFGQTYRRYLDLQKAESQAREAQIEAALERVRARALAMQQPDELMEVAKVLRQEMGVLGVEELETSSIYINDEQAERAECWYALKDIRKRKKRLVSDHFALDLKDTWVGRQMLKFYKADSEKTSIIMKGKNRIEWIRYCEKKSKPFRGYYGEVIPDRTYQLFKFSHGAVGAATPGDISDEHWGLLKRAAAVFSLAYSRFKDLSQAREDLQKLKEEKRRAENALTELKSTQSQLIHAEKMASLGELTAGIAHEIQNPLNFVNNFSEVSGELVEEINEELKTGNLKEIEEITVDLKQNLEKINHHGQRASGIVKGMLEHSRTGSGKKELTDINKLADEYLRLSYHGLRAKEKSFNADFKSDFDETLPKVKVIAQDLGRVILNLINNAFYAVSEKTKADDTEYKPVVVVSTKKLNTAIEIIVQDNGYGIPKEIVDKIFQPFFTTKPSGSGTGLGLSMSYDIITKGHGGELKVRTVEGVGTEFLITLPY